MKRAAIYLRVSTSKQETGNQRRELEAVATRSGWQIVKVYEDAGISGARGRDKRLNGCILSTPQRITFGVGVLGQAEPAIYSFQNQNHAGQDGLSKLRQNAPILEQGCAGFSPGSANRCDQCTRHSGRTSPPLRPSLSFRYTQPEIIDR
jgi:Resolvase, N terminal domain